MKVQLVVSSGNSQGPIVLPPQLTLYVYVLYLLHPQVRRHCLSQVNLAGHNLADYNYKDIEFIAKVISIQIL